MLDFGLGDRVSVAVVKADGSAHRQWQACVEKVGRDYVAVVAPIGSVINVLSGSFVQKYDVRATFWQGRPYTLTEFYNPDGSLRLIYSDICSPVALNANTVFYVDHELDVACWTGQAAEIVDEDEFAEAIAQYGYSTDFQRQCYAAAAEALALVRHWQPAGVTESFMRCP